MRYDPQNRQILRVSSLIGVITQISRVREWPSSDATSQMDRTSANPLSCFNGLDGMHLHANVSSATNCDETDTIFIEGESESPQASLQGIFRWRGDDLNCRLPGRLSIQLREGILEAMTGCNLEVAELETQDLHHAISFEDDWTLIEHRPEPGDEGYLEAVFAQANGYLGMRGSREEGAPSDTGAEPYFVCQGVFDQQPGRYETDELVNLPDWLEVGLEIDNIPLRPGDERVVDQTRSLSLRDGMLTRRMTVELADGELKLILRRLLSEANRHLLAWQMHVRTEGRTVPVRLRWGFTTDRTNRGTIHFAERHRAMLDPAMVLHEIETLESDITVSQAQSCRLFSNGEPVAPRESTEAVNDDYFGVAWTFDVEPGGDLVAERTNAVCTSRDRVEGAARDRAVSHAFEAAEIGFETIAEQSRAAWADKWARADVRIEGDPVADRALRYCAFQLMQANLDDDERTAIGAKALSGPSYRGHFFWDTELFMEPFFAHTNPPAARNLVSFRHRILPGAQELAEEMGYEGARWPWEATRDGREQCPDWLPVDGGEVRIVTGRREDHISADVAWGAWYYYVVTGDEGFWRREGLELVVEAARFWRSRVQWVEEHQRYELLQLMGPDENHELVDNNAYTNYTAAWTLRTAAHSIAEAKSTKGWEDDIDRLGLTEEETQSWLETARAMYLPLDDSGLIPQHDGFPGGVAKGEVAEPIKQADVLMLLRIFPDLLPVADQVRNYEIYEPLTEHGSSLSPSVHAQVAARLGLEAQARHYLRKALLVDLADTHENTAEGLHAAALGGAWMAVVQGVGGLWLDSRGSVHLDPALPKGWECLRFGIRIQGGVLRCAIQRESLVMLFRHPRGESIEITVTRDPVQLHSGRPIAVRVEVPEGRSS